MSISITVKSKAETFTVDVQGDEIRTGDVKAAIQAKLNVPTKEQRLVLNGRILSDVDAVLDKDVLTRSPVHLVKTSAQPSTPTAPTQPQMPSVPAMPPMDFMNSMGGAGGPGGFGDMGDIMGMVNQLIQGDGLSGLTKMFEDPSLKSTIEAATKMAQQELTKNPNLMSEVFNNQGFQSAIQGLVGGSDEDFNGMFKDFTSNVNADGAVDQLLSDPNFMQSLPDVLNKSVDMMKNIKSPNNQDGNMQDLMSSLLASPGMDSLVKNVVGNLEGSPTPSPISTKDAVPETSSAAPATPAKQSDIDPALIDMMVDLGFTDMAKNTETLKKYGGDVDKAIHDLLNQS